MNLFKHIPGSRSLMFRIMLPAIVFVLIFSLFFIALNNYYTAKLMEQRLEREALRIFKIAYESRFILNQAYLERLGALIEGRVAVFHPDGRILAASFEKTAWDAFSEIIQPLDLIQKDGRDSLHQEIRKIDRPGGRFLFICRALTYADTGQQMFLVILSSLSDLETAKKAAAWRMVFSAGISLLIAFVISGTQLKKMSRSFSGVLSVTREIAAGKFGASVAPSDIDEINMLSDAVNQMSEQLKDYEKRLIETTHIRSSAKITAAMAHEIKNPLSSMKMLAQLLAQRLETDSEGREMTAAFINEVNRVDNLVSDLRTLSGTPRYHFSGHDPVTPLTEVISVIRAKLDHLNIELETHADPFDFSIKMDRDKVKQVLWNLLMNAAQSMPGGGKISARVSLIQPEIIEYCIQDQGGGIPPEEMGRIFAPFYTTRKEGIGIGLYVCREIAAAHHGDINVDSSPEGTSVRFQIPAERFNKEGKND